MAEAIDLRNVRATVSAQEWQARVDLAAAYRLVAHYGWDDMIFTHLSARVPGSDNHFLINPYGLLFEEVTASNLVKIDFDGNVVLDNGYTANAAGFTIHSAVHMAREDAHAVMHLHTDAGVAVSGMRCGFLPLNQHAMFVYEDLAYHDWEGVALNLDERERLIRDVGDKHLLMLRNHGTLTMGANVASCFMRMYYLERACAIQVKTLAGGAPNPVSQQAIDAMRMLAKASLAWEGLAAMAWPALLRLVTRESPGFDR
ncbi:MAG: class II aldolase/adducin family protein [Gammaproteobacteria bacterium]|nr:class II aldolase/adducin family protein [Gammaproteobacteria bacterium]